LIRIEREENGGVVAVHEWRPRKQRWVWFGGLMFVFVGLPSLLGGWEVALFMGAILGYPIAVQCFNDRYVRLERGEIVWWERPLPLRRTRRVKVEDVVEWAYGMTPMGKNSTMIRYSVGVVRRDGRILQAIEGEDELAEARNCAEILAKASGKRAVQRGSMRGKVETRMGWILVAVTVGLVVVAMIWILMGSSEG
jgi:hypothetical protein